MSFLITESHYAEISVTQIKIAEINLEEYSNKNLTCHCYAQGPAYVIYTSGSTGDPKGIIITHRNIINFLLGIQHTLPLNQVKTYLALATVAFDISGLEIFLPLLEGACIILADNEMQVTPDLLINLIEKHDIDLIQATPVTWRMLADAQWCPKKSTVMLCGGEAFSAELSKWFAKLNHAVFNVYGPTETTIWSSVTPLAREQKPSVSGILPNIKFYLVDTYMNVAPINSAAELCIAGEGLARGYLNHPMLTAEKFIPNPFGPPGSRMYRTGDLVRWLEDGNIEYLGRMDHQVKIRGFRIECGEIEAHLSAVEGILQAVVIVREDKTDDKRLVAYVVGDASLKETALAHLKHRVPDYMIPSSIVFLDKMPLTPSGKIDRKALPSPEYHHKIYVAPRNEIEIMLSTIWQEVLGVERVGIDDNFFELGGHSLLTIKVITALRKALQRDKIPLSILFQYPTIRQIGERLNEVDITEVAQDVVCLQTNGSKSPLFLLPGTDGFALTFIELSKLLGDEHPIYGLQYPGLFKEVLFTDIESLATYYIENIRKIQPVGPYYFIGWSMGGIVAYEITKQLEAIGERVNFLGVIDIAPSLGKRKPLTLSQIMLRILADERVGVDATSLLRIMEEIKNLPEDQLFEYMYTQLERVDSLLVKDGKESFEKILQAVIQNSQLLEKYSLKDSVEQITYFYTTEVNTFENGDVISLAEVEQWQVFSRQPMNLLSLSGNHFSILRLPHVTVLANYLKQILAK